MKWVNRIKRVNKIFFVLILGLLVFSIVGGIFNFYKYWQPDKPTFANCDDVNCTDTAFFLKEKSLYEKRLREEEPNEIYKDLLTKYAGAKSDNQHRIAHIFGQILYFSQGSSGIGVCDSSFAFGCYHGFFNEALKKDGIESVQEMDQQCIKKFGEFNLGCQHGIGHGLAEYFGPNKINEALDICNSLQWKHQLMGCSGGVFMEATMPTLVDIPGAVSVKIPDGNNPYTPCNKVKSFIPECYYSLGIFFIRAYPHDPYQALKLCSEITNKFNKKICLMGAGNAIIADKRQNIDQAIKKCQMSPNKESEIACRSGAGWILFASQSTRQKSTDMCSGLNEDDASICIRETNLLETALST